MSLSSKIISFKNPQNIKWVYLSILSVIWGSSFILMKIALDNGITPLQLGALRIIFTAIFLLIVGFKYIKRIKRKQWKWVIVTSILGTFIPVFMFAYAESEIDSSIASILNSLTPLNTLILGYLVFNMNFSRKQLLGVIVGLLGTLLLILFSSDVNPDQNYYYAIFVVIASICYAFNVNIIKKHLQDLNAMSIAVGNFIVIIIPSCVILLFTDFLNQEIRGDSLMIEAILCVFLLSVFGTGIAKVMFNKLVQISTPIFASSVTYTIPIIALLLGILYGEKINALQLIATFIILLGVFLANRKKKNIVTR